MQQKLNINENWYIAESSSCITDPAGKAVNTCKNIPTKIRKCGPYFIQRGFYMWNWKKIQGANLNKVTTFGNIPTKILK